jgi:hypothetical protein
MAHKAHKAMSEVAAATVVAGKRITSFQRVR